VKSVHVEIVAAVTPEHGAAFVESLLDGVFGTEALTDAFADAKILTWPLTGMRRGLFTTKSRTTSWKQRSQ
jgi:hypothetical protein